MKIKGRLVYFKSQSSVTFWLIAIVVQSKHCVQAC